MLAPARLRYGLLGADGTAGSNPCEGDSEDANKRPEKSHTFHQGTWVAKDIGQGHRQQDHRPPFVATKITTKPGPGNRKEKIKVVRFQGVTSTHHSHQSQHARHRGDAFPPDSKGAFGKVGVRKDRNSLLPLQFLHGGGHQPRILAHDKTTHHNAQGWQNPSELGHLGRQSQSGGANNRQHKITNQPFGTHLVLVLSDFPMTS
mmetsp:Transcript_77228/g.170549  ORF Transcript_77228/g.170549 Transcript_77228/m.170549 type:complete len:203 (-) Transcript_77228:330-938(-)